MSLQQTDTSLPGWVKALGVVLLVLVFLYAVLIGGALLLWVVPVLSGFALYLS